jgi:hypothetical protein
MKEQIIKKPNIYDYPSTDERTYIELDGKVNWEKYAKALEEFIQILAECKCDHSEDKLDKIDKQGGWICPRCQKVHNWMVQSCDCPANVITANTTGPIKELAEISGEASCNNCKYQDTCNENSDDECKWEPIKTE